MGSGSPTRSHAVTEAIRVAMMPRVMGFMKGFAFWFQGFRGVGFRGMPVRGSAETMPVGDGRIKGGGSGVLQDAHGLVGRIGLWVGQSPTLRS